MYFHTLFQNFFIRSQTFDVSIEEKVANCFCNPLRSNKRARGRSFISGFEKRHIEMSKLKRALSDMKYGVNTSQTDSSQRASVTIFFDFYLITLN